MNFKNSFCIVLLMCVGYITLHSQSLDNQKSPQIDRLFRNNMIAQFDGSPKAFRKEYFLFSEYKTADIFLNTGESFIDTPIKIDFYNNYIVIDNNNEPFTISAFYIEHIVLKSINEIRVFVPKFIENKILFAEVVRGQDMLSEKFILYKYYDTYYVNPNYNAALDNGSKVGSVRKTDKYFYEEQSTKKISLIPSSKRKFKSYFQKSYNIPKKQLRKYNHKKESDLLLLLQELE